MPKYQYRCQDCDYNFEIRHSMFYKGQICLKCNSEKVFKLPSIQSKKKKSISSERRAGAVVDEYIKDARKDLANEKKDLKKREL